MKPILSIQELQNQKDKVLLFEVGNGTQAYQNYLQNHLENAIYVEVNFDLSSIGENPAIGGRHPLPTIEVFKNTIQKLGIHQDVNVVLYDRFFGANSAARFW